MANSRVLLGVSFLGTTLAAVVALFWFWNKKPGERRNTDDEARSRAADRSHVANSVPSTSRGSSDTSTLRVTTRVDGISGGAGAPSNGCRQKLVDRDIVQGNETCLTEGTAERSSSVQSTCTTNQSTSVPQERTAVLCSVKGVDQSNCEADLQPEVVAQTTYSQPSVLSTVSGVSPTVESQQNLSDSGIEQIIASDEQSDDELDMPDVGVCRNRDICQNVQSNLAVSESEHSSLVHNTAAKTVVDVIVHESIERQNFDPTQQEIVRSTENSDEVPESEQCTVHVCLGNQDESSSAKTADKSAESVKGTDLALSQPLNDQTSGHGEISLALSVNVAASSMDFSDHEDILSEDSDSESSENEPVEVNEVLEVERSNFLSEASCTDDNKAKIEYDIEVDTLSTNKTPCLNVAAKDTSASLLTSRNTPDLSASNLIKAESISADSLEGFTEKENYSDNTQSNSKISDDMLKIDESEHCVETSEDCKVLASKPGGVNISMDEEDVMSIEENSERCDLEDSVVVVECASREPSQSTESGLSRDSLEPPDSLTGLLPATEVDTDNVAEEEDVPVTPTEVNSRSETVPNPERGDAPHVNGDNTSEASNDSGKGASLVEVAQPAYPPDVQIYQIDFPTELCGRLIGRHGKNIISIKQKSGSNISLRSNPFTSDYQICSIEGLPHEIEEALAIMRERFPKSRYPNLQLDPTTAQNEQPVVMPDLQMTLPPCVSVDVIVSSVANGGLVFLQQPTHPTFPSLERLSQFMLACYTQDRSIPQLPRPVEAGVICAAPMSSGWYRAVVVDMSEDGEECDVKFMDYGGYSRLSVAELRQIRSDFMTLPFQAVECYMGNLTPVQGELTFGAECASILEELTQGKLLQAQVVGRAGDGIPFVHIYQVSGNKALFVNREMVNRGVAQWIEQL